MTKVRGAGSFAVTTEENVEGGAWREQPHRRETLEKLGVLRCQIRANNPDLSEEEAYRIAGFSRNVTEKVIESDRRRGDSVAG